MTAKKRSKSVEKELKSTIKQLRADLERADARADRWKKKAGRHKKSAAASEAKLKELNKSLEKSADDPSPAVSPQAAARPDASWTVVRLRAEARSRGIAGLAGKSKAELLAALT